jgi:DNA modification methylase
MVPVVVVECKDFAGYQKIKYLKECLVKLAVAYSKEDENMSFICPECKSKNLQGSNTWICRDCGWSSHGNTFYQSEVYISDCLKLVKKMPSGFVDLICTSPPYNQGRGVVGGFATGTYDKYNDQMIERVYRKEMMERFDAMVRILKPTGSMFIVIGQRALNRKLAWPFWITQIKGMKLNGVIIRRFKNSPQIKPVRFFYRYEPVFWLYRNWPPKFNSKFAEWGDCWDIEPQPDKRHPAVMPMLLAKRIIKACTKPGDLVFDPFNGIGTSCIAAKELNRKYIGCDISTKYCKIARDRLNCTGKQTELEDW